MQNDKFPTSLKEQVGKEDSALRRFIADTVLRKKDSMRACQAIIDNVYALATSQGASKSAALLSNPSGIMLSRINNAIFYNAHSVTRSPNAPNSPSKSPKFIADKVLEEIADILSEEIVDA